MQGGLKKFLVEPHLSRHNVTDPLSQQGRRIMFHEDPGDTNTNQLGRFIFLESGGHDQDFTLKTLLFRQTHESRAVALTKAEVNQNNTDLRLPYNSDASFIYPPANDVKRSFISYYPSTALPKHSVIIDQENLKRLLHRFSHLSPLCQ